MKKFISYLSGGMLLLVCATNIQAQTDTNCWGGFNGSMQECLNTVTDCNINCGRNSGSDTEKNKNCLGVCDNTYDNCTNQASGTYKACVGSQQQKETPPAKSDNYLAECWGKHMQDEMAVCGKINTKCLIACKELPCMRQCNITSEACMKSASAAYDACVEIGRQAQTQNATSREPTTDNAQPQFDEAACHDSCQSDHDACASECKSAQIFADCSDQCNAEYNRVYESIRKSCFDAWWSCGIVIKNTKGCGAMGACGIVEKCDKPYEACLQPAADAKNKCLASCNGKTDPASAGDTCANTCDQTRSTCSQNCRDKTAAKTKIVPTPENKPSVGVSSRDFKALVRTQNELRWAQAELEKLKTANDPRWEEKKAVIPKNDKPPQLDNFDQRLERIENNLERVKDGATVYLDIKEFYDFYKNGKFGNYGGVSLITDVGSGLTKFVELVGEGKSVQDATTKSLIDTAAPSVFNLFPPLKGADMVATMPDRIMNTLGFAKNDPWRKITILIKESAAPSTFVEKTTNAMIETKNWTNVFGALAVGIEDISSAPTFGEKISETGNLVYSSIGAVAVGSAMWIRDTLFGQPVTQQMEQQVASSLYSWFTYPE